LHEEVLRAHGLQGLVAVLGKKLEADALQLNRTVLESAQYLALTSETDADLLRQAHRGTWLPPLAVLPDGDAAAAAYAHVIRSAMAGSPAHTIAHLADALGNAAPDEAILNAIALHAVSNRYLRKRPRLLLDVTQLAKTDARSGIQRVVKNIAREIAFSGACDRPLELVRQADGKLWRASEVIAAIFDIDAGSVPNQQVLIHPGDTLLMIDSSWEQYEGFRPIFEAVRQSGGMIVTVIYDLIPLRLPDTCSPGLVAVFNKWIALAFAQSDMLLCISRAVADDVWEYLAEHDVNVPRKLHIAFWPLGADIGIGGNEASIRAQVRKMTDDPQSPLFLMVGTIEPRKGHDFVLDAFESLWRKGQDLRLCIAGAVGWMVGDTVRRIREHPQFDKKLFFVERFTDAEINVCYAAATGLIAASRAEGFGLPIVEAALHQVPVLASDIPVFREVGGDGAIYFSLHDCEDLAAKIIDLARLPPMERKRLAGRIRITTWRESARHLLETVLHGQHVYRSARCSRTGISMNMEQSLN
jgi:glycosyltransferase involved in cell wall biosynthesis